MAPKELLNVMSRRLPVDAGRRDVTFDFWRDVQKQQSPTLENNNHQPRDINLNFLVKSRDKKTRLCSDSTSGPWLIPLRTHPLSLFIRRLGAGVESFSRLENPPPKKVGGDDGVPEPTVRMSTESRNTKYGRTVGL